MKAMHSPEEMIDPMGALYISMSYTATTTGIKELYKFSMHIPAKLAKKCVGKSLSEILNEGILEGVTSPASGVMYITTTKVTYYPIYAYVVNKTLYLGIVLSDGSIGERRNFNSASITLFSGTLSVIVNGVMNNHTIN